MTPKDMMVVDANAEAMGISRSSLMENAGCSLAQKILEIVEPCRVTIFGGVGGNGGDGFVAARHLLNYGFEVEVLLLGHSCQIKSQETLTNWEILQNIDHNLSDLQITVVNDSSQITQTGSDVVVDALLGTGAHGEIKEPFSTAIDIINQSEAVKVAVDIPSGLDPHTGVVSHKAVKADHTITFHRKKTGLEKANVDYVGTVHVCDIGIPRDVEVYAGPGDLLRLRKRDQKSHKGQNGRVLIIGGSKDYSGAPALAALAVLGSGADLSIVTCPKVVSSAIRSYSQDLIVKSLPSDVILPSDVDTIIKFSKNVDSVVLGCGIGTEEGTKLAVNQILENIEKPVLLDADALKLVDLDIINQKLELVLTPHSSEFKAVFGTEVPENLDDKISLIRNLTLKSSFTILLKGKIDLIGYNGLFKLNKTGNPGMTVGGTGDCLAGLVGGLMAQGHSGFEAALLGAYINGRAGDLTKEKYGYNFTASDILRFLPQAFLSDTD
ncbi:MAG: NAD(P)H-hydrate dehydratase [Methanobacteriaceae archaeon]|nr:NAD(P)H-hydrate dehydratase [Methanobacteriaceae archaeon]